MHSSSKNFELLSEVRMAWGTPELHTSKAFFSVNLYTWMENSDNFFEEPRHLFSLKTRHMVMSFTKRGNTKAETG